MRNFQISIFSAVKIRKQCLTLASGDFVPYWGFAHGSHWGLSPQTSWAIAPQRKFLATPMVNIVYPGHFLRATKIFREDVLDVVAGTDSTLTRHWRLPRDSGLSNYRTHSDILTPKVFQTFRRFSSGVGKRESGSV